MILGRTLRVDHTRYKKKDDEPEGEQIENASAQIQEHSEDGGASDTEEEKEVLKEEYELRKLIQDHDEDDPMKAFLVQEKREELALALTRTKDTKTSERTHKHRHRHHRSRREPDSTDEARGSKVKRSRHESDRKRSRSRHRSPADDYRRDKTEHHHERPSSRRTDRAPKQDWSRGGGRDSERPRKRSLSPQERQPNSRHR